MQARRLPGKAFLGQNQRSALAGRWPALLRWFGLLACVLAATLLVVGALSAPGAAQQKQEKDKDKEKKEEKKGGGGLFTGFRKVTGIERSQEQQTTVSAGARGVGEGKDIGNVSVSQADRARVAKMEASKPSQSEMTAFLQEGKLSTVRKGGGQ